MTPALPFDADELMGAAALGGSVRQADAVINAARAPLPRTRIDAVPPAPPAPPPTAGLAEADVRRLMDEREKAWSEHSDALQRQIDILAAMVQALQARKPPSWRLTQTTDPETGAILEITATPLAA